MRIALLCGTRRGWLFLKKLTEMLPDAEISVFSFPEETWEPPFLADIRELAVSSGGEFFETRNVAAPRWRQFWDTIEVDLMLVVSWRYMIPKSVYSRPRLGTFVFHDSLLPEYRGFSPTVWAIINGEDHTGVTLFEIAEEVDSGDIVAQERVEIMPTDTIAAVMERVTQSYLNILESNLSDLMSGNCPRRAQDHSRATYTCKRVPEDNLIDWSQSSEKIYNLIRAVSSPYPGAHSFLSGRKLKVWAAEPLSDFRRYVGRIPGRVVQTRPDKGTVVLTGDGALLLTLTQFEGEEIVCAAEAINSLGHTLGR